MAPKKVSVTVKFSKPGIQPPIYLAGSFSEWQPQEMQHTVVGENEYHYHKDLELEEGSEYQYKFRIGEGDWWTLDEGSQIATDDMGNQNNLLTVPIHVEPETTQEQPESPKMAPKDTILERAATTDNKEAQVEQHEEDTVETQPTSSLPSAKVQEEAVDFSSPSTQNKEDAEFELEGEAEIKAGHTGTASAVKAQEQAESLKIPSLMDNIVEPADITNKKAAEVDPLLEIKPQDTTTVSPAVNTEMDGIGETQRIDTASKDLSADENVSPTLVVEKIDSNPSYGDDFGAKATIAQKDAHLLRAKDAEPDYVMVRAETSTPDLANVAAEVADSAATLDQERDPPTPPISDEEAGRIGFRRMSSTPIPEESSTDDDFGAQVADTAAEVANSAAVLDKDHFAFKIEMPPPKLHDGFDSGEVTPWEERAPRFAHECPEPPRNDSPMSPVPTTYDEYEGRGPRDPYANMVIDENDPSLEEFPSEREAILEHVRSCQRRLSEDETTVDGIPPSPVVGPNHNSERHDLPIPSPNMLARHGDRSPSLDSIPEEHGHREELLSELPKAMSPPNSVPDFEGVGNPSDANGTSAKDERETSVEVQEVGAETPPLGVVEPAVGEPEEHTDAEGVTQMPSIPDIEDIKPKEPAPFVDDSVPVDDESPRGIVSPDEGPNIMVSPATPGSSLNTKKSDPFDEPIKVDTAKATAIEEENGRTNLKSRKPPADRPITPTSMRSQGQDAKSKNFLKAYLHLFFVEWIGGLIMRLCGGGRHTLIAVFALLLIVAPALYFSA